MRLRFFFWVFLLMPGAPTGAAAQSFYKKYFPPDNIYSTIPWSVSQRPDGRYWMAAGIYEAPSRLYITGLEPDGTPFVSTRLSADQNEGGEGYVSGNMTATADGGCVTLLSQSINAQSDGWILVKLDANAGVEWAREISGVGVPGYGVDFLNDTPDGIWVFSRLWALGNGLSQTYFGLVGLDGTVQWERVLVLPSFLGTNTSVLPDGRLLAILNTGSLAPIGHLLALTPGGNLQPIVAIQNTVVMDAVQHSDGRLFIIGHTPDIGTTESQLVMGCYQNGQFLWAQTFTLSKEFYTSADILLDSTQDSLTVTVSNTAATGARYLLRFDLEGQLSWARWIPSYENLQSHTAPAADGGYLWISTSPDLKPVVAKTDAKGLFAACDMAPVCQLDIRDTVLKTVSQTYNFQHTVRMQPVAVSGTPRIMQSEDYCPPLPLLDAAIQADSAACRQSALQFGRNPAASGFSEWQFPGVLNTLVTGVAPVVTFPDTGLFTVRHLLTLAGCTDTATATIRIHPVPEVELPPDNALCPGDSLEIQAEASVGATLLWENGDQSTARTVFETGLYSVTVSNAQGCSDSDQMLVYPPDLPDRLLPADTFFCESSFITLMPDTSAGWQFTWADGMPEIARRIEAAGIYVLQARSPEGCMLDDSIAVTERPRPEIDVEISASDSCGRQVLRVQDATLQKIRWSTGVAGNTLEVNASGQYEVTASDGFCEQTISVVAEVERCPECFAYFPNIIRPESGTENAEFAVQSACAFSAFLLRIYDRWGALMFESKDPGQAWDAYWRGKVAPPGVYTFVATGTMQFEYLDFPFERAGTVLVLR